MLVFAVAGFYLLASWLSRYRVLDIRVTWNWNRLGSWGHGRFPSNPAKLKNLSIQDLVKGSSFLSGGWKHTKMSQCCLLLVRTLVIEHKCKDRPWNGMERGNASQVRTDAASQDLIRIGRQGSEDINKEPR